ncbi:MAG: hypothetical protein DI538_06240 [Azospira oryzae]|nr:MAG: hypothetical protein DI538_06240 [Azospira oryzae]
MSTDRITYLWMKHFQGDISAAEKAELSDWLNESASNREAFNLLHDKAFITSQVDDLKVINERKGFVEQGIKQRIADLATESSSLHRSFVVSIFRWASAIGVAAILGFVFYYVFNSPTAQPAIVQTTDSIGPLAGTNKAVLVMADGRRLVLDSAAGKAIPLKQGEASLDVAEGVLAYKRPAGVLANEMQELQTPAGGQYRLVLSDGTVIWLNAGSSVSYPTYFTGSTRSIGVKGEVYIEVARDASKPFIVEVPDGGKIEVLGTKFAINCYDNEPVQKTTLVEGSIRIQADLNKKIITHTLHPGQQSINNHSTLSVIKEANVEEATAFARGFFYFSNADARAVARQLERWYNIKAEFKGAIPPVTFSGKMERSLSLKDALEILKFGNMEFVLNGNKISM